MFSPRDHEQVSQWNAKTPVKFRDCIHESVIRQVQACPDALAIDAWDATLTYGELDQISNRLARHLITLSVGLEVMVPLCFDKSAFAIVAMLAVLKAGGVCVSMDPSYPVERFERVIEDAKATIVLTSESQKHVFAELTNQVFAVDSFTLDQLQAINSIPSLPDVKPNNAAFIIYTSGSTGVPKGVILEHGSICTNAATHGSSLNISSDSRVLQFAAYVFDVSIQEIFTTLIRGGCVCVPSEHDRINDLSGFINKMNINWIDITPTVASMLRPDDMPQVKTVTVGGEALTKKVIDIWEGRVSLNNCYGPAECTITSSWNGKVGKAISPSNIGHGIASLLWVVDPTDCNYLAPVGAVGELMIEGPLLSRGYLNDQEKTNTSFVFNPAWTGASTYKGSRRLYKTGDLVRYNSDGSLEYIGRKDSQVKVHGQRLELGEIEHHLLAAEDIESAIVVMPKSGLADNALVAVIALKKDSSSSSVILTPSLSTSDLSSTEFISPVQDVNPDELNILSSEFIDTRKLHLRDVLSTHVPKYMVPTIWVVVESIPVNTSGKLDRNKIRRFIENMDHVTLEQNLGIDKEEGPGPTTAMDRMLQQILSDVLNLPAGSIAFNRSFQAVGGDSITAMQVVTRARAQGIAVRVQDILGLQTIAELGLVAKFTIASTLAREDEVGKIFDLSPMQQMYFQMGGHNHDSRFNQSFFLRLTRRVDPQSVKQAAETLVRQHSMLRARFVRDSDGKWSQMVSKDTSSSYVFNEHGNLSTPELVQAIEDSQVCMNIESGPVFVVTMANQDDGQLLFLAAHHLVIDLVSWRIILHDLEEILETGALSSSSPFPFQAWTKLQSTYAKESLQRDKVLPYAIEPADYAYWSIEDSSNNYSDTASTAFAVDVNTTSLLLESCQDALGTDPVEIFMATLLYSFRQVFEDRKPPTIFIEGHGRESWDSEIDITDTIGWFTTLSPLYVPINGQSSVIETIRYTKDTRRQLSNNGWPYFAYRFCNQNGIDEFKHHFPMEVVFNYLGRYQQLERAESLLKPEVTPVGERTSDVSNDIARLALFEVSVAVSQGVAQFSIAYNRHIARSHDIQRWAETWKTSLKNAAQVLSKMEPEPTLQDFPLASLTYESLENLKTERLSELGLKKLNEIEDIYPCSPMQEGLILSQATSSGNYEIDSVYLVNSLRDGKQVNIEKLLSSWQQVVDRHSVLRTVFLENVSIQGVSDQVVLKRWQAKTKTIACETDEDVMNTLRAQPSVNVFKPEPQHQLTLFTTAEGNMFIRLEMNHAIVDAVSSGIIAQDLILAYDDKLPVTKPLYSDYIKYIQERPLSASMDYWTRYLAAVSPCHFPTSRDTNSEDRQLQSIQVELDLPIHSLKRFCTTHSVTIANIAQVVWGLVLRAYTGSDNICFGYLSAGRDIPIDSVDGIVGPLINMMVSRMDITGEASVIELTQQVQSDYLAGLDHQHCSLAQMQHGLALFGRPLFNTIMSVQRVASSGAVSQYEPPISLVNIGAHDPTEVSLFHLKFLLLILTTSSTTS